MIFMTHPLHGATNVLLSEVEAMKAAGWTQTTHEDWLASKRTRSAEAQETMPKRRGRPPKATAAP